MRVLVTGGAGYIGSHACKALAKAGHEPIVFDNLSTGHVGAVRWGPIVVGDIRNPADLDAALRLHKPEMVMHFAALAYVGVSMTDPGAYYGTNIGGTLCLLEAMQRAGIGEIVFSSTCATYGEPDQLPITESTMQRPINPYGFSKLAAERLLADFERAYGLKWVALRYFNAAGADPEGELGEEHDPETHAIPLAIQSALGLRGAFKVMGTDYATPDGTAIRDYVHVSDLAQAHCLAVDYLLSGGESGAFNLATGIGVSVRDIVDAVSRATGRLVPIIEGPRRAGDPEALYATGELAREVLGWTPRYISIVETVETAARWFMRAWTSAAPLKRAS
ncbi:MAG: UDP-glucose 4-epimerase [Ramlibacter sp.]|nr:UDP-glucose 4-epimerase [Ramlibacter sp.]